MNKFSEQEQPLLLEILSELISHKTITPKGKNALIYISALLKEQNFHIDLQKFGVGEEETWNLYAVRGEDKPNICFAGHVDVVPPGDIQQWATDPFKLQLCNDTIYGRGVVDMKGAIACSLAAIIEFIHNYQNHKGAISILLTTDEEGDGKNGTKKMLDYIRDKYNKIDFCILGEPSSEDKVVDMIKIGRRGSINYKLRILGKQGHVAYPHLAENPLSKMVKILSELKNVKIDDGNKYFSASNLEITSINCSNNVSNIIPSYCDADFNIRFNNLQNKESLLNLVLNIITKHSRKYDLDYNCTSLPFIQKYSYNMEKLVSLITKETGAKPLISTSGGTSDARYIHKYTEIAEIGLKSDQAHKINEHCKISDLQMLYNVYYSYLVESLGSKIQEAD